MSATDDTKRKTDDTSGIRISRHAQFRAMQRLGAIERPAGRLRELLWQAELVGVTDYTGAHIWRVGDITIFTDSRDEVVKTVVRGLGGDGE